jgi:hypothetical protein
MITCALNSDDCYHHNNRLNKSKKAIKMALAYEANAKAFIIWARARKEKRMDKERMKVEMELMTAEVERKNIVIEVLSTENRERLKTIEEMKKEAEKNEVLTAVLKGKHMEEEEEDDSSHYMY